MWNLRESRSRIPCEIYQILIAIKYKLLSNCPRVGLSQRLTLLEYLHLHPMENKYEVDLKIHSICLLAITRVIAVPEENMHIINGFVAGKESSFD